jgi:hypothetical protein
VPRGRYLVDGEVEEFACAAGPGGAGWRYTGVRRGSGRSVDLTLDGRGRPYRVEVASPDWVLRGGAAGTSLLWVRRPAAGDPPGPPGTGGSAGAGGPSEAGGSAGSERSAVAHGFLAGSPAFWVALSRLVRLPVGQARRLRLVEVSWPALATRLLDVEWRHVEEVGHPAGAATLTVSRYDATPLDTGRPWTVHLAGDVVVAGDGVELLELE